MQPDQAAQNNPAPQAPTPPPAAPAQPAAPAPQADSGYQSNPFKLLGQSWKSVKLNLGTWIISVILYSLGLGLLFFIPITAALIAGVSVAQLGAGVAIFAFASLIALIPALFLIARFSGLFTNLILEGIRGHKLSFKQAWSAGKPFGWRLLGGGLLVGLTIAFGFLLLIIPGIIALAWFTMTPYVIVNENKGIVDSMKRSKQLAAGRFWEILGAIGVTSVASIFTLIPVIGWLITLALGFAFAAVLGVRYVQLKEFKDSNKPLPPVDALNYAAVVLMLVVSGITSANNAQMQKNQPQLEKNLYEQELQMDSSTDGSIDSGSTDTSTDSGDSSY